MATEIVLPQELKVTNKYLLSKELSAVKLLTNENGKAIADGFVHLPIGAELQGFGQCFDARSLLVRFEACFYVVFQEDLDTAQQGFQARSMSGSSSNGTH